MAPLFDESPNAPDRTAPLASSGQLVDVARRTLPLREASLSVDARGGLARVVLTQRFENPWPEPLRVVYRMPLPERAAVSGYAFTLGERRIVGEVDRRARARERFEEALLDGRTAGLVEEERPNLFTQELGNVPPGAAVLAELTLDQPLDWDPAHGAWQLRFPTAAAPRYLGAPGAVPDAAALELDVARQPLPVRLSLSLTVRDALTPGGRPASPSHGLRLAGEGSEVAVSFADSDGVPLDRDVVVRWPVAGPECGLSIDVGRPRGDASSTAFGLLTLVPPAAGDALAPLPRDLILLIDTSGSMHEEPLRHAVRVASALVDTLEEADRLEMVAFGRSPVRWKRVPVAAGPSQKRQALDWLAGLSASGGTEMRAGLLEALSPLRGDSQRQVVLITDGQIGGEREVVKALRERLPAGCRLHAVGIGSAVNGALTGPMARAGRGVEVIVGLGEDVEPALRTLRSRTSAPTVVDLAVDVDHAGDGRRGAVVDCAPERLPDLFAGAPVRVAVSLRPEGGAVRVHGRTAHGAWEQTLVVGPTEPGQGNPAVARLFARELVEDLEVQVAAAGRASQGTEETIARLGVTHQISTRLTSWVAIDEEASVDPTLPSRREVMPQALPYGQSIAGLGLRGAPQEMLRGIPMGMPAAGSASRGAPQATPRAARTDAGGGGWRTMEMSDDSDLEAVAAGLPTSQATFLEKLRRVFVGEAPASPHTLGPHPLSGRVVTRGKDHLTVEVTLAEALDLPGPTVALLTLADGRTLELTIEASRSTRPGHLEAGQVLRLHLRAAEALPDLAGATLQLDGHLVIVLA